MLDSNVPRPWQGRTTLVFSLAAVAFGLGNVFRLPWLLGEHGGGPFFLAYVLALLLFAAPIMLAEVTAGSYGRSSPIGSLRWVADQSGASPHWQWLGALQAVLALLLAVQVGLITVWMIEQAVILQTGDLAAASARDVAEGFSEWVRVDRVEYLSLAVLLIVAAVLAVPGPWLGMAVIGWLLLPGIVVALLSMVGYSLEFGAIRETEEYLFRRDLSRMNGDALMAAVISAAFTLGAGVGVGLCFGGRSPTGLPLARSVLASAVLDTLFALVVAIVVMPLILAVNIEPAEGIALVFVALPYAFANLPLGEAYGALFFGAIAASCFAALVALLEPAVMTLRHDLKWPRWLSAVAVVVVLWVLTIMVGSRGFGDLMHLDLAVVLLLPVSHFALAVVVGWIMPRPLSRGELFKTPHWLFALWWWTLRWLVPPISLAVAVVAGLLWWNTGTTIAP